MAMKWVREYIYYFGGDANRVTIGGMSAGGQSIQVHLMAPSSWPFLTRPFLTKLLKCTENET